MLPEKPKYEMPRLPRRITEETDDALMELFVGLTRWTDHYAGEAAKAEVEERSAESGLKKAEAVAFLAAGSNSYKARAERDLNPDVCEWRDSVDLAHAKRKLIGVMRDAAERDAALVSRELTRRLGRQDNHERRTDRWRP